jgi:hypothetical protein
MEAADLDEWMPCAAMDRRKSGKTRQPRHLGRKVARLFGLLVLLLMVGLALRKVARPIVLCYTEARGVSEIKSDLTRVQKENKDLRRQRIYLGGNQGAQAEARKLGWVAPGERSLVLEAPLNTTSPATGNQKKSGLIDKVKDHLSL